MSEYFLNPNYLRGRGGGGGGGGGKADLDLSNYARKTNIKYPTRVKRLI